MRLRLLVTSDAAYCGNCLWRARTLLTFHIFPTHTCRAVRVDSQQKGQSSDLAAAKAEAESAKSELEVARRELEAARKDVEGEKAKAAKVGC